MPHVRYCAVQFPPAKISKSQARTAENECKPFNNQRNSLKITCYVEDAVKLCMAEAYISSLGRTDTYAGSNRWAMATVVAGGTRWGPIV